MKTIYLAAKAVTAISSAATADSTPSVVSCNYDRPDFSIIMLKQVQQVNQMTRCIQEKKCPVKTCDLWKNCESIKHCSMLKKYVQSFRLVSHLDNAWHQQQVM